MEGEATISQVRVDVAELKGILTTIVADYGRRLVDLETNQRQLRTDLTVVKDQMETRLNGLIERGSESAQAYHKELTQATSDIKELNKDFDEFRMRQFSMGTRIATYISPFISAIALVITAYTLIHH